MRQASLSECPEDILPLAEFFRERYSKELKRETNGFSDDARRRMLNYPWPGNVRELLNRVKRFVLVSESPVLEMEGLDTEIHQHDNESTATPAIRPLKDEAQEKMDMAVMYLDEALAHIRAGKADIRLLDGIRVDSYGSMVPINNVAAVNTPDARSIAIKPWDKNMFRVIEKAIIDSELGIMPENNGEIIRIGIPPLTEERRKQLAKQCKAECETAKVSVRNARRDAIDALKKAVKDGMAEDEQKNSEAKLQKVHDKYIKQIDDLYAAKDKEIMTV